MEIKLGSVNDAKAVAAVEAACFPAAEAATEAELKDRLRHYGSHFWLMWDGEKLAGFVDGMVTNQLGQYRTGKRFPTQPNMI